MKWDNRMKDNRLIQILKAAIPYMDVAVGEEINMEGLLSALRPFARGRERQMLDTILQFIQMKHMMEMVQMFQTIQQFAAENTDSARGKEEGEGGGDSSAMMEMLKAAVPPEQQDMVEMLSAMMTMPSDVSAEAEEVSENPLPEDERKEGDDGSVIL